MVRAHPGAHFYPRPKELLGPQNDDPGRTRSQMPYPLGHRANPWKVTTISGSHCSIINFAPILLTNGRQFHFGPPDKKAPARFELAISCLLDRRFNQLSHGAGVVDKPKNSVLFKLGTQISSISLSGAVSVVVITSALHAEGRQFEPGTAQF